MKVPPAAVINIIRENLNDRYRKGFPILKELIQIRIPLKGGWLGTRNNSSLQNTEKLLLGYLIGHVLPVKPAIHKISLASR